MDDARSSAAERLLTPASPASPAFASFEFFAFGPPFGFSSTLVGNVGFTVTLADATSSGGGGRADGSETLNGSSSATGASSRLSTLATVSSQTLAIGAEARLEAPRPSEDRSKTHIASSPARTAPRVQEATCSSDATPSPTRSATETDPAGISADARIATRVTRAGSGRTNDAEEEEDATAEGVCAEEGCAAEGNDAAEESSAETPRAPSPRAARLRRDTTAARRVTSSASFAGVGTSAPGAPVAGQSGVDARSGDAPRSEDGDGGGGARSRSRAGDERAPMGEDG